MRKQGSAWQDPSHVLYTPGMQATCFRSPYQLRGARTPGDTGALPAEMLSALPCQRTLRCFAGGDKPRSRSKTGGRRVTPANRALGKTSFRALFLSNAKKKKEKTGAPQQRCPAKAGPQALAAPLGARSSTAHPQDTGAEPRGDLLKLPPPNFPHPARALAIGPAGPRIAPPAPKASAPGAVAAA